MGSAQYSLSNFRRFFSSIISPKHISPTSTFQLHESNSKLIKHKIEFLLMYFNIFGPTKFIISQHFHCTDFFWYLLIQNFFIIQLHSMLQELGTSQLSSHSSNLNQRPLACIIIPLKHLTVQFTNISELQTEALEYPSDAKQVLESLNYNVQVLELGNQKYKAIHQLRFLKNKVKLFLNMYDCGNDTGQAIIDYLVNNGINFIGASTSTYPNRRQIKKLCLFYEISTAPFLFVDDFEDLKKYRQVSDFPLFVKPEQGYDSICVSERSIVRNQEQLIERVKYIWSKFGGALIEPFIPGGQFTVLVAGSKNKCVTFPAIQFIFDENRNIISFEDKWGSNYKVCWKAVEDIQLNKKLQKMAKDLYFAAQSESCARLDIRQDRKTGDLFVIDFNVYPTMFLEGDICSVDKIIKFAGWSKRQFMQFLIDHAQERSRLYQQSHRYQVTKTKEHGLQIVASQDIKKGQLVYTDQMKSIRIVSEDYVRQNWTQQDKKLFEENSWPIGYKVYGIWSQHPQQWKPINHSCDPNLYINGLSVYARRDIKKGQELTIHFSTYTAKHPQFKCWCKSDCCKGKVLFEQYKTRQFQQKFKGQLGPYIEGLVANYNQRLND